MNTATASPRRHGWKVVDIVVASVLAVACALVFFCWDVVVSPAVSVATVGFPPAAGLVGGAWLLAGVLGGLVVRKPGAALYTELVAAVVSALLASSMGAQIVLSGLVQGLGAELVFLLFLYRRFSLPVALLSGLVSGVFMTVSEWFLYYPYWAMGWKLVYLACGAASGLVLAGLVSWLLVRALVGTGVLDAVRAGKDARAQRRPAAGQAAAEHSTLHDPAA